MFKHYYTVSMFLQSPVSSLLLANMVLSLALCAIVCGVLVHAFCGVDVHCTCSGWLEV